MTNLVTERARAARYLAGSAVPLAVLLVLVWVWQRVEPALWLPLPGPMSWYGYLTLTLGVELVLLGLVLLAGLAWLDRWAARERRRSAAHLGRKLETELPQVHGGVAVRLRRTFTDPVTVWRGGWSVVSAAVSVVGLAWVPLAVDAVRGVIMWSQPMYSLYALNALAPYRIAAHAHDTPASWFAWCSAELAVAFLLFVLVTPPLARLHARMSSSLLAPTAAQAEAARLSRRVAVLTESRSGAVDAHSAELRRIERDLHDGTQAQLVTAAMRLGVAERAMDTDPAAVATLVRDARTGVEEAMGSLRDVVRTMYPPVLTDRGLRGALAGLGARNPVPTSVEAVDLDGVPAPVEAAVYFVVAEALTNVVKHSGASHVEVGVRREGDRLVAVVTDDGLGGADEARGTGIVGMRHRVEALDGWLDVTSPVGGPTAVVAELPCAS